MLNSPVRLAPSMPQIYDAIVRRMEVWMGCQFITFDPVVACRSTGRGPKSVSQETRAELTRGSHKLYCHWKGCCHRRNIRDYCGSDLVGRLLAVVLSSGQGPLKVRRCLHGKGLVFRLHQSDRVLIPLMGQSNSEVES